MDEYPITSEDPVVRHQFAENIFQILRPLSASEMPRRGGVFDEDSSECSALSDPFSDLDESYILLDQRKKKPGADESDELLLMNQFTPEFRSVYDELLNERYVEGQKGKEESSGKPNEAASCRSCIDDSGRSSGDFSPKFRSFIDDMLRKCDLQHHQEEKKRKEQQQAQHKKQGRVRTVVSEESVCVVETDSLSGIWRMLDAVSENEDELFPTTGPHYDLYYDRRFAWMTRDEIAWDQIEASRKKCEHWLKLPCQTIDETSRPK